MSSESAQRTCVVCLSVIVGNCNFSFIRSQLRSCHIGAVLAAGAMLLVNTCLPASGLEEKQDAKALASPATLAAALDSTNAATRFYAVDSLGKIGGSETIGPLVKALHDPDAFVRIAAAKALGHSADSAAMAAIVGILKTENDADVWNVAAKPLLDQGPAAIPGLLEVFRNMGKENEGCRVAAVQALGSITDRRAFEPLVKALVDPSPAVRDAAHWSLRSVTLSYIGIKVCLLLLVCRFLAPLVYAVIKLISYFRHRPEVPPDPTKGSGTKAKPARVLSSLDLVIGLSCIASVVVFYVYTNHYVKEASSNELMEVPLYVLFPAIVMIVVFDIARITFKAVGMFRGSGKALFTAWPLRWLKRTVAVVWGLAIVFYFLVANLAYILRSNDFEHRALGVKSALAQASKQGALVSEEEARQFASIVSQAKEAVQAVDSRYLDQQQKEQVMDTFVKLISIRSPSYAEGQIRDELKQMMEQLGAKEIDCRKGDSNAPFNLVMEFAASEDLKDAPAILLNAHIDTVDESECKPEGLEFDKAKSNFYHRDNGSYGADDKSGVTMVVEAVRALKRDYWDKGHSHRRVLVVFTAQEESGRQGAQYLTTHHRRLFSNLDFSFTVDGWLYPPYGSYEYPQTPHLASVFMSKVDTFKARQVVRSMEDFAKERNKPIGFARRATEANTPIDAFKFPPEAYKVLAFMTPNHGTLAHTQERNNVGQLIDCVDMLINVLVQLEADYANAIAELTPL
jgi:putative aminopeptidase FrvX